MIVCWKCKTPNRETSRYCIRCGALLNVPLGPSPLQPAGVPGHPPAARAPRRRLSVVLVGVILLLLFCCIAGCVIGSALAGEISSDRLQIPGQTTRLPFGPLFMALAFTHQPGTQHVARST